MDITFGFIGFGKMANAICKGAVLSGFLKKENVFAYDVNFEHLTKATSALGVNSVKTVKELMEKSSVVLIATKPFVVDEVINNIKDLSENKLIISILAGIKTEKYENLIKGARIVRVMPNTPAMVNEGMSVVCGGKTADKSDVEFVRKMFSKLGSAEILNEDMINAVTAVSGSGPAFYYYIIDKIARGGEKLGLDYSTALKLSAQTALGAAKMILETGNSPTDLITAVTTPNGTTAEGNKVLENSDIQDILYETVDKTYKRAVELGNSK